jgi:tetratricopeptide (TPR) repeat protein
MRTPTLPGPELSARTEHMVGRKEEIRRLDQFLHDRGCRHFCYYWAGGGLGKTRLLQELQNLVREAGRGYYTTGIIDFYHTDTHSTSDIERAIVDGLDPAKKYFPNYRRQRQQFELLRERGADPGVLEERRAKLSDTFVRDCRDMALDARKLVICFDTIELLQYESSVVEEMAGLDAMDARVKPWLLDKLAQLNNVLVVFAGRPKQPVIGEELDPQARLVGDMQQAFGGDLTIVELTPFDLTETEEFIATLTTDLGVELIPKELLPVVHRLTEGKPIFLHLVVDLLQTLSPEPRRILALFEQYADLVDAADGSEQLENARQQIQKELLNGVFNEAPELGGYLERMAIMPKGVDAEILHQTLGLPVAEAESLLQELEPLSFVKHFIPPPGAERLHGERTFLHDEMYDLLTLPWVVADPADLKIKERSIAHALTENYYNPLIAQLRQEIEDSTPEERVALRERMQKLQVERLYYLLTWDPGQGYAEYQSLSEVANSQRWVGLSMRLLDEFLRFYNNPNKRETLDKVGISHEEVVRDSALMWVERFWWWGYRKRVRKLGRQILDDPSAVLIHPDEHVDILGNICALWARAYAVLEGYNEKAVQQARAMLDRLPALPDCTPKQALARARLLGSIGYHHQNRGLLEQAVREYAESLASFRQAGGHLDEYSMLLNNLAHAYAVQGRFVQARMLAHDALQRNEKIGYEYATGLTLSTLAGIAQMRGNYPQAIEYGQEALELFQRIEDAHGTVLAYQKLATAARRLGKHESEMGRRPEEAQKRLEEAIRYLQRAQDVLQKAGMGPERFLPVYGELGRAYRDMGNLLKRQGEGEKALRNYHEAQRMLERALKESLPIAARASVLEDLAEAQFMAGDEAKANATLAEVERLIGSEYQIVPGKQLPAENLATEHFSPLGKVELLRGQMAFEKGRFEEGVGHYLLAYAYFKHFSAEAAELDTLMGYIYIGLQGLAPPDLLDLMEVMHKAVREQDFGVDVHSFAQVLEDLVGI